MDVFYISNFFYFNQFNNLQLFEKMNPIIYSDRTTTQGSGILGALGNVGSVNRVDIYAGKEMYYFAAFVFVLFVIIPRIKS